MEISKERLARGYSISASAYDQVAGPLYQAGFLRLLPRLNPPPHAAILDVGCGTGINLVEAARFCAPARLLAGIDLSDGMVNVARTKLAQAGLPAQIVQGDAEHLPWPDDTFDVVIANSVFHWFTNKLQALLEMKRVLRPGGQVALIFAAHPAFAEWFALLENTMRRIMGDQFSPVTPSLPTVWDVIDLLHQSGLSGEFLNYPNQSQPVTNMLSFSRLMATVAPHWATDLDPVTAQAIVQSMQQEAQAIYPHGLPVTFAAIELVARKPHM